MFQCNCYRPSVQCLSGALDQVRVGLRRRRIGEGALVEAVARRRNVLGPVVPEVGEVADERASGELAHLVAAQGERVASVTRLRFWSHFSSRSASRAFITLARSTPYPFG